MRVADRDLVTDCDEVRGERAADVTGADDPDPHRVRNLPSPAWRYKKFGGPDLRD